MAFGHEAVDGKGFENMINPVINLGRLGMNEYITHRWTPYWFT